MEDSDQPPPQLSDSSLTPTLNPVNEKSPTIDKIHQENFFSRYFPRINSDAISCDLLISLLVAALNNYKKDSVLRPFPPQCVMQTADGPAKNFDKLKCIADSIPAIENAFKWSSLNLDVYQLLSWILDTKNFTLKSVDKNTFKEIKKLTGQTVNTALPTHIFEVEPSHEYNTKFENERKSRDLIYAYHGSRIENFHSILHNGLCNHLNKNSLFGEGTYLSSELHVCMPYSQIGQGWTGSQIGDRLSCIAVCEIISDAKVCCNTKQPILKAKRNSGDAGKIPEKYYIVQNDELLRVKYLLIYAQTSNSKSISNIPGRSNDTVSRWVSKHRFALFMIAYLVLLLAIGLGGSNSNTYRRLKKFFKW